MPTRPRTPETEPALAPGPVRSAPLCRAAHGLVLALTAFALIAQFVLTGTGPSHPTEPDPGVAESIVRYFSFFTMDSNLLVAIGAIPIVRGRTPGFLLRVVRLNAIPCIVVTGVVHRFLLRPDVPPTGFPAVVDGLLHIVVPILATLTWLLCGPRGLIGAREVGAAFAFPVLYAAWTFAHGAMTSWYPYPFIDVGAIGLGPALRMAAIVFAVVGVLTLLAWAYDRVVGTCSAPFPVVP